MALSERYFKEKFEGKTFNIGEVSKTLNIPVSTVYSIIRKLLFAREIVKIAPKTYKFYEVREIKPAKAIEDLRNLLLKTETRRFKFTVYNPDYDSEKILAEEVYHIVFEIIREASPKTFKTIQAWHKNNISNGNDQTLNISEAFSQEMAKEELGHSSSLPQSVVKHAQKIFSDKNNVQPCVIEKVKDRLSVV